jgi:hypothetical protein
MDIPLGVWQINGDVATNNTECAPNYHSLFGKYKDLLILDHLSDSIVSRTDDSIPIP